MGWLILPLGALAYCAFALVLLRAVTGEWPELFMPGSHTDEWSSELAELHPRVPLRTRLRGFVASRPPSVPTGRSARVLPGSFFEIRPD
ncbi:MAG: hypothetical protein M3540_10665 [Actinomycetota bacterium]|nr:hypothetical protein [Actinomycetota bacterium]